VQVTHERVEITADIPDDETTANIVSSYTSTLQRMLAEEAGPVASPLDGRFQVLPLLISVHPACHRACVAHKQAMDRIAPIFTETTKRTRVPSCSSRITMDCSTRQRCLGDNNISRLFA
jgi:hypothetical protein